MKQTRAQLEAQRAAHFERVAAYIAPVPRHAVVRASKAVGRGLVPVLYALAILLAALGAGWLAYRGEYIEASGLGVGVLIAVAGLIGRGP